MKKMMTLVMMMTIAISATAMSYSAARNEALFLSDKMAYELGLSNTQYEAVYEINLDYLLNVDTRADVFGFWWEVRNRDLGYVLSLWQYDLYMNSVYFYRPLAWNAGNWTFAIYSRYGHGRMFMHRPNVFVSFRGGHNHRGNSFYAGRHYNKPTGHMGNGNRPSTGYGSHNTSRGNNNSSINNGFGSNNNSSTTTGPTRIFVRPVSGNVASNSNNTQKGHFGGRR